MSPVDRSVLQTIVEPVVQAEGLDLEELNVSQAGRRSRLQIVVDAAEGVDLDRCADASRVISQVLDASDVMGDAPYTLEVSSPGVSRPLTLPRHWSRAVGRLVRTKLTSGDVVSGRVQAAGEMAAVVDTGGETRDIAYDDVAKARIEVEFSSVSDAETG